MSEPREALKRRIAEAFREAPYPGDDAVVDGDPSGDLEALEIVRALRNRHWSSLTRAEVQALHESLPLLSPASFRFFLPAYMIACIDGTEDMGMASSSILFNLEPGSERCWKRVREFNAAEVAGIVAYLEYADELDRREWGENAHEGQVAPVLAWWREHEANLLSQPRPA